MNKFRTWVEIDERALTHNIDQLRGRLEGRARFCAVVKANAYGHGLREVSHIAAKAGVDAFAVDSIDDALQLRGWFPSALVLVIGYVLHERVDDAVAADIHLTVYDADMIRVIEESAMKRAKAASIHLKIDTGASRQGILPGDAAQMLQLVRSCPHIRLAGLATHFANIEDTTDTRYATLQLGRFEETIELVRAAGFEPEWIHSACSAAVILYPETHGSLVRGGIALYGLWPSEITEQATRTHKIAFDLAPVLSWKTRVAQVKSLPAGTPISYGLTEILKRPSRIAILPVGYSDGYDRGLSSVGEVIIGASRCKVLGRVCMNLTMVDVSEVPNVVPEMEAVLIGRSGRHEVTAAKMAAKLGTISYEVVARINPTLPRLVV